MNYEKSIHLCNSETHQDRGHFYHSRNFSHFFSPVNSCPQGWLLFQMSFACFRISRKWNHTCVHGCVRFLSLRIMFLRFSWVFVCLFIFTAKHIPCMTMAQYVYPSSCGWKPRRFKLLVLMNRHSMNILIYILS